MRRWVWLLSLSVLTLWGQSKSVGPPAPPPSPEENRANLILNEGLANKNPDIRKQAVAALGLIGPREPYLSEIATALSDKDFYVQLSAIASLVDLKDKGTADLLSKALDDSAPEVSFAAAKALFALGDPRGRTALLAILERETKTQSNFLNRAEARHVAPGSYSQGHDDVRDQEWHRLCAGSGHRRRSVFDAGPAFR